MSELNNVSAEVIERYNTLHRFLNSGFVNSDGVRFLKESITELENDTGIQPQPS